MFRESRDIKIGSWLSLEQAHFKLIYEALRDARGNTTQAARWLGCGRSTIFRTLRRLGYTPKSVLRYELKEILDGPHQKETPKQLLDPTFDNSSHLPGAPLVNG